jgi:hypothetical protein
MNTFENENYKLEIIVDEFPTNPRENDNLTEMICFHNRYNLGDKHNFTSADFNGWDDMLTTIQKTKNPAIILSLHLFDHSGITISTSRFGCRWDSGQIGYVYITKEKVYSEYNVKRISRKLMKKLNTLILGEVDVYDNYLTGEVYGYSLLNKQTGETDSCFGFYGSDINCNGIIDCIGLEAANSLEF